jgi:predicted dehydrogenase
MKKLRIGVVGVGYLGQHHARIYSELKNAELVGVVDVDFERAKEIAKKFKTQAFRASGAREGGCRIHCCAIHHHALAKAFFELVQASSLKAHNRNR